MNKESNSLPGRSLVEVARYLRVTIPDSDQVVSGLTSDSRSVQAGYLFLAIPGERNHGAEFVQMAESKGAIAVITDEDGALIVESLSIKLPIFKIDKPRESMGNLASWFYREPSSQLFLAGITGTNGKTTTTYLLEQIWSSANRKTGLIGTVGIKIGDEKFPATHTTPESDQLQSLLAKMVSTGVTQVAMEVSSHALSQGRVSGTHFAAVGFTNLSQDHLDFHGDMESYYLAKRSLFKKEFADKAFVVVDSEYGKRLYGDVEIAKESLSVTGKADWYYESIEESPSGFKVVISGPKGFLASGNIRLIGQHNLENLLLAVAIASVSGLDADVISHALPSLTGAPGRLERVAEESPYVLLVDYAHTPDAVNRTLGSVRKLTQKKVIAVLGCGGDRDRSKRPLMGAALNSGSDIPIFTSDNPRSEDPSTIVREMVDGLHLNPGAEVIIDRKAAIRRAIEIAEPGDLVIVLGKGHETGQEIHGVKHPFSDQEELRSALRELK